MFLKFFKHCKGLISIIRCACISMYHCGAVCNTALSHVAEQWHVCLSAQVSTCLRRTCVGMCSRDEGDYLIRHRWGYVPSWRDGSICLLLRHEPSITMYQIRCLCLSAITICHFTVWHGIKPADLKPVLGRDQNLTSALVLWCAEESRQR